MLSDCAGVSEEEEHKETSVEEDGKAAHAPALSPEVFTRLAHGPAADGHCRARHLVEASLKASCHAARLVFVQAASLLQVQDQDQLVKISSSHENAAAELLEDIIQLLRERISPKLRVKIIFRKLCTEQPLYLKHAVGRISVPPSEGIEDVVTLPKHPEAGSTGRVPPESLHLILSLEEVHWLGRPVARYRRSLAPHPRASRAERGEVARQAARDWERFLCLRARELRPGGCLLVSAPARDPSLALKGCLESLQEVQETLQELWESFQGSGRISREEFQDTNFQCYARSRQEFLAPFQQPDSPVLRAGLSLAECTLSWHDLQPRRAWRETYVRTGRDERAVFADDTITLLRWRCNGVFLAALDSQRPLRERETIVDDLFQNLRTKLSQSCPEDLRCGILLCHVMVVKQSPEAMRCPSHDEVVQ